MRLQALDWAVIAVYCVVIVGVGLRFAKRAGKSVDEYFLSGRSLGWFLAGTSMVASSFSCDTPLAVTGWVRDAGIWKNWIWWCYLVTGMLTVFVFARRWRRGGVMTKAELAELRYGGKDGRLLRGVLGLFHACITNTLTLCWVLLAAAKILDVLLGVDKLTALLFASSLALAYSIVSGLWGVVVTDMPKFWLAMLGSVLLAVVSWDQVGGSAGVYAAVASTGAFPPQALDFFPAPGPGGPFDASFWTVPLAAVAVYLGLAWWSIENADGSAVIVQRLAASRDGRQGMLAVLWFNVANYALRPWPWIMVAVASLILLPPIELTAPVSGTVAVVGPEAIVIRSDEGVAAPVALQVAGTSADWQVQPLVAPGERVAAGSVLARTDSERAYATMMGRYLPAGLLGLAVVGLMAAFMSTVDTHINLAASFFVNDVWRRFIRPAAGVGQLVLVGRLASAGVMALALLLALWATSIRELFEFFLTFLGGVGPVYILRWLWWRVRAVHEIAAMLASAIVSTSLAFVIGDIWPDTPLTPGGVMSHAGRLCLVVGSSLSCVLLSMPFVRRPDPAALVAFYRRVQPIGFWGPVAALAPDVVRKREAGPIVVGLLGGLACVWGGMIGVGLWLFDRGDEAVLALGLAVAGGFAIKWAMSRLAGADPQP